MGARTGSEYVERLGASDADRPDRRARRITGGVPEHPAFRGVVRTYAELYDLQHDPALRDVMTYESPTTRRAASARRSWSRAASRTSCKRRAAMKAWADHSLGTLGRTGDYLNSALMALSEAADVVRAGRPGIRRERPPLLREGARGGPADHAHADPAAGEPQPRAPRSSSAAR